MGHATTTDKPAEQAAAVDQAPAPAAEQAAPSKPRGRQAATKAATLTPEQAARKLTHNMQRAELPDGTTLTVEQQRRAVEAPAGLSKKALAVFILEGKSMAAQVAEAKQAREAVEKAAADEKAAEPRAPKVKAGIPFKSSYKDTKSTFRTYVVLADGNLVDLRIDTTETTNDAAYQARVEKALRDRGLLDGVAAGEPRGFDLLTMNVRYTWTAAHTVTA